MSSVFESSIVSSFPNIGCNVRVLGSLNFDVLHNSGRTSLYV